MTTTPARTRVHLDRGGDRPRCGVGSSTTSELHKVTCDSCLNLLLGLHNRTRAYPEPEPCGSAAAYQRHRRTQGPVTCQQCLAAERARNDRRAAA